MIPPHSPTDPPPVLGRANTQPDGAVTSVQANRARTWSNSDRICATLGVVMFALLTSIWVNHAQADVEREYNGDWVAFDQAAGRAAHGPWTSVYTDSIGAKWPFLYPPYAIALTLPLAAASTTVGYVGLSAVALAAMVAALRHVQTFLRSTRAGAAMVAGGVLSSGVVAQIMISGQVSWLFLLGLTVAGVALARANAEHETGTTNQCYIAGSALAILILKPNLLIVVLGYLVVRRNWRTLAAFSVTTATTIALSLAGGTAIWSAYLRTLHTLTVDYAGIASPIQKEVTLLAAARMLLGGENLNTASLVAWGLVTASIGAFAVRTWWRPRHALQPDASLQMRLWSSAVLATVAFSPRLYFYDALLLALPVATWRFTTTSYVSTARHRAIGVAMIGCAITQSSLNLSFLPTFTWITGPLVCAWLVLELVDLKACLGDSALAHAFRPGKKPADMVRSGQT